MCIVTKGDSAIEFDTAKIYEAVCRAMEDVMSEIEEAVKEAVERVGKALYSFAHSITHWLLHAYYSVTELVRRKNCFDLTATIRFEIFILVLVRFLAVSFLQYFHELLTACLKRIQDRGSSENSDSDCNLYLGVIPA